MIGLSFFSIGAISHIDGCEQCSEFLPWSTGWWQSGCEMWRFNDKWVLAEWVGAK